MARTPRKAPAVASDPEVVAPDPALQRRSMGLKLLLVCGLALLMSIPAFIVFGLIWERSNRASDVATEIGELMGGPQTFLGPVIAVPYSRPGAPVIVSGAINSPQTRPGPPATGVWYIFPTRGTVDVNTDTEVRRRSLFRVTVYEAELAYAARFDLTHAGADLPEGAVLDWSRAELMVGASDARGARTDITLTVGDRSAALAPSNLNSAFSLTNVPADNSRGRYSGDDSQLRLFGTPLTAEDRAAGAFDVAGKTTFSGAQSVSVLAFAGTTEAGVSGDWPHPSYGGGLPRNASDDGKPATPGFSAAWSVPSLARGVPLEGEEVVLRNLGETRMSVDLIEPANPYQSVTRSLKYAPMFIGIVFLTFFMFETIARRRVHPAQYVLIGLVQVMFYMLLLSIAEYIGFHLAFLIAAAATVGLISAYAGWTFDSRAQGLRALVTFSLLYGLIYLLMRLQEGAFVVGALAAFAALAAVMYFTRKVDWYGVTGLDSKVVL